MTRICNGALGQPWHGPLASHAQRPALPVVGVRQRRRPICPGTAGRATHGLSSLEHDSLPNYGESR